MATILYVLDDASGLLESLVLTDESPSSDIRFPLGDDCQKGGC